MIIHEPESGIGRIFFRRKCDVCAKSDFEVRRLADAIPTRRLENVDISLWLLSLPDDALLAVLAFLSPRELFVCRVVCRRLRDACLHPRLWRHAAVDSAGVLRAAFALAPRIGRISDAVPVAVLAALAEATTCVVCELHVGVNSTKDAVLAADAVQKLAANGGLVKLSLLISCARSLSLQPLLKAAYSVRGLQSLDVTRASNKPLTGDWCDGQVPASATRLQYDASSADGFLALLLRTHAATLEEVKLPRLHDVPVSLLAGAPRLRSLECALSKDLSQLAALPGLAKIKLASTVRKADIAGGVGFLARTSHLREVCLTMPVRLLHKLLPALAASPSASFIQQLYIDDTGEPPHFSTNFLAPFIPKLASLQTLTLMDAEPQQDLLQALGDLPSFQTMKCIAPLNKCTHGWLHDPAMQHFLVANYHVHLLVMLVNDFYCHECVWCRWGCHKQLKGALRQESYEMLQLAAHNWRGCGDWNCVQIFGRNDLPFSDPL